ncbi:MAG TPA: RluA family pseudouridine synthase, partial [Thermomicrobiales bacterium]|nr:RluA family pseudouridine synthase [Thermomicrobiales bacterium]
PADDQRNERLDRFIAGQIPELSRSTVQSLIDEGLVLVDGIQRKASFKVTPGEVIAVEVPPVEPEEIVPEDIPLDVLYEDDDVIVINKAAGMVVHPAAGHASGTLVNALRFHWDEISKHGTERSGIVHRLDKDTSGVMIVAKHNAAMQALQAQWLEGAVTKRYVALVHGVVQEDEAVIDVPIARDRTDRKRMAVERDGRNALTVVHVRERFVDATLLDIDLRTGRTHQIRVHLAYIKHPILGDVVYGTQASKSLSHRLGIKRQMLHAAELGIVLPSGGDSLTFTAPLPTDLESTIQTMKSEMSADG